MPSSPPEGSLPCITIDCVIFGFENFRLKILLVKRDIEPSRGMWALPGGWIEHQENLNDAARRILEEASGMSNIYMEQLRAFGEADRFPLSRIITIAYTALISPKDYLLSLGPEVSDIGWFDTANIPPLTFDHNKITNHALAHLRKRVREEPISFELLPEKFTLPQLLSLYESILEMELDSRNFRKKLLSMNILKKLNETEQGVSHRAAQLYSFDREAYEKLIAEGFVYEFRTKKQAV